MMLNLIVLASLLAYVAASGHHHSSSSSESSLDTTEQQKANVNAALESIRGGGLGTAEQIDALINTAAAKAALHLAEAESSESESSSSSSDDDDDASFYSSSSHQERRDERDAERILAAIKAAAESANASPAAKVFRKSYQAKFWRTKEDLLQSGDDDAELGPAVIVVKRSATAVTVDSFDGDNDGTEDVKAAADAWAAQNNVQSPAAFLREIRNRATVNGGSINLVALVVSGTQANGAFAFADADRVLISPCFPVESDDEDALNVEIYLGVSNFDSATLARTVSPECIDGSGAKINPCDGDGTPYISVNEFYTGSGDDRQFLDRVPEVGTFSVEFVDTQTVAGSFVFEYCTAFSYFA